MLSFKVPRKLLELLVAASWVLYNRTEHTVKVSLFVTSGNIISTKYFLLVWQFFPVNPSTQIHLYPFSWYNEMHLPAFLQGELSHKDYTGESI